MHTGCTVSIFVPIIPPLRHEAVLAPSANSAGPSKGRAAPGAATFAGCAINLWKATRSRSVGADGEPQAAAAALAPKQRALSEMGPQAAGEAAKAAADGAGEGTAGQAAKQRRTSVELVS